MFIDSFREDFKTYVKKVANSAKSDIWQPLKSFTTSEITGIIVVLRIPREVDGKLGKQISEYVMYTEITQTTWRGDLIQDGEVVYEVVAMRKVFEFWGVASHHTHYLKLIE